MSMTTAARRSGLIVGRISRGRDLLDELTALCRREGVRLGRVEAIGALEKARLAFYDQSARKYRFHSFRRPLELVQLAGNVSIRDGAAMVHAHVTLSDRHGRCFGGHLAPGTIVFACEFIIEALDGKRLERWPDEATGLALWPMRAAGRLRAAARKRRGR